MPSTRTPGIPYASALTAIDAEAVCPSSGTEIAQPLFSHTKTHGDAKTPAKLSPVWKSLAEVAPSPNQVMTTRGSLRIFIAIAVPVAWMICVRSAEMLTGFFLKL